MRDKRMEVLRSLAALGCMALAAGTASAAPGPDPAVIQAEADVATDEQAPAGNSVKIGPTTWTLYGFVEASAAYEESRMNSIRLPGVVLAESPGGGVLGHSKGRFAMWARNSRLGIRMKSDPLDVMFGATPSAALEFDFMGGGTGVVGFPLSESVTPLRIRKAYVRLQKSLEEKGWAAVQMGQDWEIISPLHPSVNEETYMWGVGNVGGFRPHLRAEALYKLNEQIGVLAQISLGVTGTQDLADADANGTPDGEVSELPNLQMRFGAELDLLGANEPIKAGLWVHKQWQETDVFIAGRKRFHGWGWGVDARASFMPMEGDVKRDRVYVAAEFYAGANLSDIRGGTQGGIFPGRIGVGSGKNVSEVGYWAEGGFAVNSSLSVFAGLGASDPENEGLPAGSVESNRAYWLGVQYDVNPVTIGFSIQHWKTRYLAPGTPRHSSGTSNRFHFFLRYAF